jgi:sulfoxide reductase heme-binding subunit YedZ
VSVATFSSAPLWYATRSTGIIAFLLLTVSLVLGVAATQRALATKAWPRFATQDLHRNISLLALVMLLVHIVTTLVDTYVHVGWWALLVPGTSPYRRLGVALGTTAFDVLLVVIATSLLRLRMPARLWRIVHWSSYGVWPLALLHFLSTGTDAAHGRWGLWLGVLCAAPVIAAVAVRVRTSDVPGGPLRTLAGAR